MCLCNVECMLLSCRGYACCLLDEPAPVQLFGPELKHLPMQKRVFDCPQALLSQNFTVVWTFLPKFRHFGIEKSYGGAWKFSPMHVALHIQAAVAHVKTIRRKHSPCSSRQLNTLQAAEAEGTCPAGMHEQFLLLLLLPSSATRLV
jgi:hypothetical protein